jgi:hypothetical protein
MDSFAAAAGEPALQRSTLQRHNTMHTIMQPADLLQCPTGIRHAHYRHAHYFLDQWLDQGSNASRLPLQGFSLCADLAV